MLIKYSHKKMLAVILGALAFSCSAADFADPPMRVARLGYASGTVSFSPAGDVDWTQAELNRPLIAGDRLWADAGARDEVQIGSAAVRMDGSTLETLLALDDRVVQLQLSQGRLNLRVRQLDPDQVFEIDTPNLALSIRQPGDYRIDVDPAGDATSVMVRAGQADAYGEGTVYSIEGGQAYRFGGTRLRDARYLALPGADEFDRWTSGRDRRVDDSTAGRYVSHDMTGYQDLDDYGSWRDVEGYGKVWLPSGVGAGWVPYRDGHWAWVAPWGWTWIDDAPWGFAVSHYGRWANMHGNWGWVPGPVAARPVYAPALVAFVGDSNFQLSSRNGPAAGVAWFPLAPREVYRPAYHASQHYFNNINPGTLDRSQFAHGENNIGYANRHVKGAVIAVPAAAFVHSQAVARALVELPAEAITRAPVTPGSMLAPLPVSVRGNALAAHGPAAAQLTRQVPVKTAPPAPLSNQAASGTDGGRPLDAASLQPGPAVQRPGPVAQPQIAAPAVAIPHRPVDVQAPAQARAPEMQRAAPLPLEHPGPRIPAGISPLPPLAPPGAVRPERHDGEARFAPRPGASPEANVSRERAGREVQRRREEEVKRDEDAKNRK